MFLGAHMSTSGGMHTAIERGESIDCTAIQVFTKSNNRWTAKDFTQKEIDQFKQTWNGSSIKHIISHAGYLINLANPSENWEKSMHSMQQELERAEQLGIPYVVLHPGSHLGQGVDAGLDKIAKSLNELMTKYADDNVMVLLENTAGQGTNMGNTFEQLRTLLDMVERKDRFGICFDTCHAHAAGYDLRSAETYKETMDAFEQVIGIDRIKAIHLNDTEFDLGARKDRHAPIGDGQLGHETFRLLLNDPRFREIPMVLETPKPSNTDLEEDRRNLTTLRGLIES